MFVCLYVCVEVVRSVEAITIFFFFASSYWFIWLFCFSFFFFYQSNIYFSETHSLSLSLSLSLPLQCVSLLTHFVSRCGQKPSPFGSFHSHSVFIVFNHRHVLLDLPGTLSLSLSLSIYPSLCLFCFFFFFCVSVFVIAFSLCICFWKTGTAFRWSVSRLGDDNVWSKAGNGRKKDDKGLRNGNGWDLCGNCMFCLLSFSNMPMYLMF